MRYEPPRALFGRLQLGREEFGQRLLTMLIVGGLTQMGTAGPAVALG